MRIIAHGPILEKSLVFVLVSMVIGTPASMAFQPLRSLPRTTFPDFQDYRHSSAHQLNRLTALFMSDIPNENDKKKPKKKVSRADTLFSERMTDNKWWKLPPPPEDHFVLIGDMLSLTVYGITDHLLCQVVSAQTIPNDSQKLLHDMVANADASLHVPVWWEAGSPQAGSVLQTTLEAHVVTQYSPLLEPVGQATTLLLASWLFSGWFHRAFLFRNTLDCSTDQALTVTGKTWVTSCLVLLVLVIASQAFCGLEDWATTFRQGDLDYLVDSLTVLLVWRFIASSMLGGGSK